MSILVTTFAPWGGLETNPTMAVGQSLKDLRIRGERVCTHVLPVDFHRAPALLDQYLAALRPACVLCLGLAASRQNLSLERFAHNRATPSASSQTRSAEPGTGPLSVPLVRGGPDRLEVHLPTRRIRAALRAQQIPLDISTDAGAFVCNALLYHLLLRRADLSATSRSGFLHIPWLVESPERDRRVGAGPLDAPLPLELVTRAICRLLALMIA